MTDPDSDPMVTPDGPLLTQQTRRRIIWGAFIALAIASVLVPPALDGPVDARPVPAIERTTP